MKRPADPPRPQLDLFKARQSRDEGASRAGAHADRVSRDWQSRALDELKRFGRDRPAWLAEDLVAWAEDQGFPIPPDKRAWGSVIIRARRAGIIRPAGVRKAITSRLGYKTTWVLS